MKKIYNYISALFAAAGIHATAQTTVNFNYTGSVQTFTVPACVTSLTIDARGASGAANGPTAGGMGGRVQGTLPVNPGDIIYVYVGQTGINSLNAPTGVYNGGGGVYSYANCGTAGTGGGASDIRLNGTAYTNVVVVAGGGGGAGGYVAGNQTYAGGNGGGLIAMDGVPWPGWPNSGGKGGTQAGGGAAGTACCSCPTYTTSGTQAQGGNGSGDCAGGGGGGGGWYGGGGSCFGGGGGGSSYTSGTVTSVTHTQGFQNGDGFVSITYTPGTPSTPSSITGPATVCSGSTNTYSISPVPGATSYTWTLPGGWSGTSTTTSISATAGSAGGTISVTANNACGSSSAQTLSVTVNAVTASTMVTNVSCNGNCNGSAMAMTTGNGPFTYSWSPGGMTTQTINNLCAGSYSVVVTGAGGCTASAPATISQPSALTLGGTTINASCNGACDGSISPVATGGTSPYTFSGSMSNLCAGTYSITVTDANNCTAVNTYTITQPGQVIVALNAGGSICNGACTTLIATAAGGNGGPFTYVWMPGNLTGVMPNVCPTTTTTYTCTATDVSGCTGSSTTTVTVFPLPTVTYSQSPSNACINWPAFALSSGSPNGGTYSGPGVSGNMFDPSVAGAGTWTIVYHYTDSNGCTDSSSSQITVGLCTGVESNDPSQHLGTYPNPFNDQLNVTVEMKSEATIFDATGRKVLVLKLSPGENHISTKEIPAGVYLLQVSNGEKMISKKIVKNN